ncbi:hypothetical protein Dimus_012490 [Dionaea muscipula]
MMTTTTRKEGKLVWQQPPTMAAALPFDVITEILLWLPVNSLLRFKSVSKAWQQLITDPDFAKLHHSRSIQSHSKFLLVLHQTQNGNNSAFFSGDLSKLDKLVEICPVRGIMNDHSCDKCRKRREGPELSDFLVGSSKGLICVFHQGKFMLSNPSTQTHRMIPCLDMPSTYICRFYVGFGYDPLSYDYKVMVISWGFRNSRLQTLQAAVYSLNSNSWREVPCRRPMRTIMLDYFPSVSRLVFVNNALHWLLVKVSDQTTSITSFDIHDETYREVPLPPPMLGDFGYLKLVSFEDCLCVLNLKSKNAVDVWVMNGYKTWWKSYFVSREDQIIRPRMGGHEHEILVVDGWEGLVQYDTRDRSIIKIIPELSYRQTITIVQSIPIMLSVKSNPSTKDKPRSIFLGMRLWRRQS